MLQPCPRHCRRCAADPSGACDYQRRYWAEDDAWWEDYLADMDRERARDRRTRPEHLPNPPQSWTRLPGERTMCGSVMLDDPAVDWS